MTTKSKLLTRRCFLPYFITQALGALNDNVFKNVLLIMVAFAAPNTIGISEDIFINLAAGLFILPFLLFSAFAGELADKFEKARFIRVVKLIEIVIMAFAAVAFIYQSYLMLLFLLFLMGTQSAFFGPIKYALLPQILDPKELVSGNALVETGTFLAILLGTVLAGVISNQEYAKDIAAFAVVFFAILGYLSARYIPQIPAGNPTLTIRFSPLRQIKTTVGIAHKDKMIFQSLLSISWFWFLGASYLTQFPHYAKLYLAASEISVSFLLALFSIGIAIGSLLCDKWSNTKIELGLVPLGALGLSLFGMLLAFSTPTDPIYSASLIAFVADPARWWVFFNLLMIGISGGIFIVPLYSIMQNQASNGERSQVIAANNIFNSLFMVCSAILAIVLLGVFTLRIDNYFLVLAVLNLLFTLYLCRKMPIFLLRFIVYFISHTLYRVTHSHLNSIPNKGGVLLFCNALSPLDSIFISSICPRPVRFVMDKKQLKRPFFNYFFKVTDSILLSSDPEAMSTTLTTIKENLEAGDVVCVFQNPALTSDDKIDPFKFELDFLLKQLSVPIIPVTLKELSKNNITIENSKKCTMQIPPFRTKIEVIIGEAINVKKTSSDEAY